MEIIELVGLLFLGMLGGFCLLAFLLKLDCADDETSQKLDRIDRDLRRRGK